MNCDELIKVYSVADIPEADEKKLGLSGSPTQVEKIFPPEKNTDRTMLEGSADKLTQSLFALLKERKFV